jgi:hypothetical protein
MLNKKRDYSYEFYVPYGNPYLATIFPIYATYLCYYN